jgi:uncharacterized protein (DUF58 family)
MTLARRIVLFILLVSLIAALATGNPIYYRLTYFWALLFFGSWLWSFFSLRGLSFKREARTLRAQVGQVFEERFEIINLSRLFRVWLEVKNESPLPDSGGSQVLTMIGGRQRRIYWSHTLLTQRGVFPLGPTVLSSGDLFGLFPTSKAISSEEALLVYPMMVEVRSFPNPPGLLPGGEALRRRTHQITPNASGVREYYPGDPLNRIHWVSTARRDRLIVKEFELDPLAEVWIILDAAGEGQAALPVVKQEFNVLNYWRQTAKVSLPPSTEEYSVTVAASLARHFIRRGRAVGLVSAGKHLTLLPPDRGGRQLGKILEALALSRAEGDLPLRGLVESQATHVPRGSIVILITPTASDEFSLVVEYLMRRGLRVIPVMIDASTFGGAMANGELVERLRGMGTPVRRIVYGEDLEITLAGETSAAKLRV